MLLHEIWNKEKNVYIQACMYEQLKIILSRFEFQFGLRALNQSRLKCSKCNLNFAFCPTYVRTRLIRYYTKVDKNTYTFSNLHDLFSSHKFIWSTRLCGTQLWSKTLTSDQKWIIQGVDFRKIQCFKNQSSYLTKVNLPIQYSKKNPPTQL